MSLGVRSFFAGTAPISSAEAAMRKIGFIRAMNQIRHSRESGNLVFLLAGSPLSRG
jgi:hypothetical protein